MTYEELMNSKPGLWNWDLFTFSHNISLYFYASIAFIILLVIMSIIFIGGWRNKEKKKEVLGLIQCGVAITIAVFALWLYGYGEYATYKWMSTHGKEYMVTQDITGEVLVDEMSYKYIERGGKILAKVSFPMNDRLQTVYADIKETDRDDTYLKYYINDKDIIEGYTEGNAYFGTLYVRKGSVGKQ